jgi:hypothetical protein
MRECDTWQLHPDSRSGDDEFDRSRVNNTFAQFELEDLGDVLTEACKIIGGQLPRGLVIAGRKGFRIRVRQNQVGHITRLIRVDLQFEPLIAVGGFWDLVAPLAARAVVEQLCRHLFVCCTFQGTTGIRPLNDRRLNIRLQNFVSYQRWRRSARATYTGSLSPSNSRISCAKVDGHQ